MSNHAALLLGDAPAKKKNNLVDFSAVVKTATDKARRGGVMVTKSDGKRGAKWNLMARLTHGSGGAVDAGRDAIDDIDERLKGVVTSTDVAAMTWHRRRYMRNIRWREVWMSYLGWFLAFFVWAFGAWVCVAYGVLIYTYLGAGAETEFITAWGMVRRCRLTSG